MRLGTLLSTRSRQVYRRDMELYPNSQQARAFFGDCARGGRGGSLGSPTQDFRLDALAEPSLFLLRRLTG